jgi:hypothetical protein
MSAVAERERRAVFPVARAGRTLDELISAAWAALGARAPVACPVCGGQMAPANPDAVAPGAPALPGGPHPGGACRDCSSRLS